MEVLLKLAFGALFHIRVSKLHWINCMRWGHHFRLSSQPIILNQYKILMCNCELWWMYIPNVIDFSSSFKKLKPKLNVLFFNRSISLPKLKIMQHHPSKDSKWKCKCEETRRGTCNPMESVLKKWKRVKMSHFIRKEIPFIANWKGRLTNLICLKLSQYFLHFLSHFLFLSNNI